MDLLPPDDDDGYKNVNLYVPVHICIQKTKILANDDDDDEKVYTI